LLLLYCFLSSGECTKVQAAATVGSSTLWYGVTVTCRDWTDQVLGWNCSPPRVHVSCDIIGWSLSWNFESMLCIVVV
jgi:hypothetical protein